MYTMPLVWAMSAVSLAVWAALAQLPPGFDPNALGGGGAPGGFKLPNLDFNKLTKPKKDDDDKKTSKDTSKEKQTSKKPSKTAKNQGSNDDDKYTQSGFNENSTDREKLGPYEESPYTVRSIQTEHAPVVDLKNPFLWIEHKNNGETSVTCAFNDCLVEVTQLINNGTYVIVHYNGDMIVITIIKDVDTYKVVSTNPYTLLVIKDGYKAKVY